MVVSEIDKNAKTFIVDDFSGGLNNSADPTKISEKFALVMDNLYFDPVKRVIKKRLGYVAWVATAVDDDDRGKVMLRFYRTDDVDLLVAGYMDATPPNGNEGKLFYYKVASNDWEEIVGTDRPNDNGDYHLAQMNDMLIIANGEADDQPCWFINDASNRAFRLGLSVHPIYGTPNTALPGGNLSPGTYKVKMTFMVDTTDVPEMEGYPNPKVIELVCNTTNDKLKITVPTAVPTYQETHIGIYRTIAGGAYYYLDKKVVIGASSSVDLTRSDSDLQDNVLLDSWSNYAAPNAKYPAVHKERLFFGRGKHKRWNQSDSSWILTGNNSRLYWTREGMAHAWPLLNYIDFSPDDGEEIRGVHSFAGRIFVFKETKHYVVTYTDDPLNAYVEEYKPGLLAERSMATCSPNQKFPNGALIWLARDRRVWLHDGARAGPISWNIQSSLDGVTLAKLAYAAGVFYPTKNWYIISVNETSAEGINDVSYILDMNVGAWYKYENFGFAGFSFFGGFGDNNELVGFSGNATDGFDTYTLFTGTNDDGTAIGCTFESPLLAFGDPSGEKQLRYALVEGAFENGQDVSGTIYRNRLSTAEESFTISGVGGSGQIEALSIKLDPANYYRLKLTQAVSGTFELFRYGFEYIKRRGFISLQSSSHAVGPGAVEDE